MLPWQRGNLASIAKNIEEHLKGTYLLSKRIVRSEEQKIFVFISWSISDRLR